MSKTFDLNSRPFNASWVYPRPVEESKVFKVLVIGAHPDDSDLLTGGLAIKLRARGHKVKYVAVTNGDAGHFKDRDIVLAARRLKEAKASADLLGVEYDTL